jgi:hypothetical protein
MQEHEHCAHEEWERAALQLKGLELEEQAHEDQHVEQSMEASHAARHAEAMTFDLDSDPTR